MLTKNYYNVFAVLSTGITMSNGGVLPSGSKQTIYHHNSTLTALNFYAGTSNVLTAVTGIGIVFGDGTTEPTIDDHKLSGNIITNISKIGDSYSYKVTSDGYVCTKTVIIKNTGTESITVGEVGWISLVNSGNSTAFYALLDRTLLDSPVVIPAGKSAQIDYSVCLNFGA